MKKLIFVALSCALLASCMEDNYDVKLKNGMTVRAKDSWGRHFKIGDKVCLVQYGMHEWKIDNDGSFADTIKLIGSDSSMFIVEYRTGHIISQY